MAYYYDDLSKYYFIILDINIHINCSSSILAYGMGRMNLMSRKPKIGMLSKKKINFIMLLIIFFSSSNAC